jgi:CO/xanthine dehydrogenase FAD-binding subunit
MSVDILTPTDIDQTLELLDIHRGESRVLAGGTDILLHLKTGKRRAKYLININELPLDYVLEQNGSVLIGANTKSVEIERHQILMRHSRFFNSLIRACSLVGSPQIRNMASIGGNIMNASPAGDIIPPLMVLGANLRLVSLTGERLVSISDFFSGPGHTVVRSNEFLLEIQIPISEADDQNLITEFLKLGGGGRERHVISVVCLAGKAGWDNEGRLRQIGLAIGAVSPAPLQLYRVANVLRGQILTLDIIEDACTVLVEEISPIDDIRGSVEYKQLLSQSFLRQFLYTVMDEQGK